MEVSLQNSNFEISKSNIPTTTTIPTSSKQVANMSASEDELPLAFRIPLKNEDYKQWCADYCKAGGKRIDNVESFNIEVSQRRICH